MNKAMALVCWVTFCMTGMAVGATDTLVPLGSVWSYLDDGSDQGTAWIAPAFDATGWSNGPAQLGYGDQDEATVVRFGPSQNNKYITTYFRHNFVVPDAGIYTVLRLNVRRDDGVVVYLNGHEVFRNNMPGGDIFFFTRAQNAGDDGVPLIPGTINVTNLVSGNNVLAAEIHQDSPGSSDISFDLELVASTDNSPPAVTLLSPQNNASFTAPAEIQIRAAASDPDGNLVRVEFFEGTNKLGEDTSDPYTLQWSAVPIGNYGLYAVAVDALNLRTTSTVASISVAPSTPPTVASQNPVPGNVSSLTQLTVTFSEPVTALDATDLIINGLPATSVSGSGNTYTFGFAQPTDGTIHIAWDPRHAIVDFENPPRPFDHYGANATWQYNLADSIAPTAAQISPAPGATLRSLPRITVTFSEPVHGIDAADLRINNVPAASVIGSGAGPYEFALSQPTNGPVNIQWAPGHNIRDFAATRNPFAGGSWSYTLDTAAVFDGQVVINEIMYHPASHRDDEEWIELFNRGTNAVNLAGWQLSRGADFAFPNVTLPAGGYLVVAANVATFSAKYPGVINVVGGWIGRLSNSGEDIELEDATGNRVDIVNYADEGEFAIRRRWPVDTRGWEWFAEPDGLGKSLELRNAAQDNDRGQNWAASSALDGTPGTANSVASANIPPMVVDVAHFPIVPKSTNSITVTARVLDEQTTGLSVNLRWRNASTTSPDSFGTVAMLDDGAHGDGAAADRVFGAVLPPQFFDKTVLEFYVEAIDISANTRTWPAPAEEVGGSLAQVANALIQVDNEVYSGTQPVYRVIMTEADRVAFAAQTRNSDAQRNVTFVTVEAGRAETRHNSGLRYRGAGSRGRNPPTMRLNIAGDRKWNNKSAINLNSQFTHAQVIGGQISAKVGLPSEYARAVQLRVNGANPASAGSPQFGSYAAVEATNGELVGERLPDDGDGNVYRASTGNWSATLNYLGTDPRAYQQAGYSKTSNATENDWTDLFNLTFALDPATTSDNEYVAAVRQNINVDLWLRYFAMCSLMVYTESSLANGRGDDYGLYRGLVDTRFIILPHDFDTIFNEGDNRGNINESIYVATLMPTINRFLFHPEFEPLYHAEIRRLLSTTFATNNLFPMFDQFLGDWVAPQTVQNMKTFAAARNNAVLGQLPPEPIEPRATISGEPVSPTYLNSISLTVGGEAITHYRYRLNNGAYEPETPVATPINLVGLADGTYTVFVIGRDSNGAWQDENAATLSQTWTVLSGLRGVVINEVLARNVSAVNHSGTFPDLIELFNPRAGAVDLSGLRLTDDLNQPNRFVFPAGSTIAAGGHLILLANDPDGTPGIHLGFSLDQNGEKLYLLDAAVNGGAVLDSVQFGLQLPNLSVGRLANGQWTLCSPSFGAPNMPTATASQTTLKINEWLASGVAPFIDDFVELYNPDPLPVAIGGLFVTDQPIGLPFRHQITPLSFLPGFSYKAFIADDNPELGVDHLSFQLAASIGEIAILSGDGQVIDCVIYGLQRDGVSQGRVPNGGGRIVFLTPPTPGAPNPVPPTPVPPLVVNLLPLNDTFQWRYNESGEDLGTTWTGRTFNDSAWPTGAALLAREDPGITPEPIRTVLTVASGKITFYFRTHFNVPAGLNVSTLQVTHAIDDGAVFHLNGAEAGRFNVPPTGPITFNTQALTSHEATSLETLSLNMSSLVVGDNVLAVEVHQQGINSSDVVFGMKLDVLVLTNPPSAAGIVINEVLADSRSTTNADGTVSDWIELRNPSSGAVDLAGMSLTDQLEDSRRWVFPSGSVIPAEGFLVVHFDPTVPASTNSSATPNTGFGLSASGDAVYLFNRPADGGELTDGLTFGLQAPDLSIGRVPAGSTNWTLTLPTPASPNLVAILGDPTRLKINEWMADPNSGEDWFEIHNPNQQPVALGGLVLTDDLNDHVKSLIPALSFISAGLQGFARFEADNLPGLGANHVSFRLSADGESLGIISAGGSVIDSVTFGAQAEGVSQGRLPDGGPGIVSFTDTATPGESNFLPLPNVVINEVLTHTDLPFEDAIELHNPSAVGVDISGWYLSDSQNNPFKFVIPANTVIPAGGYVVFYENEFNTFNPNTPFSLSSANGDEVHLSQAIASRVLTGYRAFAEFGAAEQGVSFGRVLTSQGADFTAMSQRTFGENVPTTVEEFRSGTGTTNSLPLVGPVVISEIMYHPAPLIPGSTTDNEQDEFVELHNISTTDVPLFDLNHPTNTWRLRDAMDFEFPSNVTLPAGGHLLVVGFNPATNTVVLDAFRAKYGIDSSVPIYGPWRGRLANDTENVELYKPDAPQAEGLPDAGLVPFIQVDRIKYADRFPWPSLADGNTNGAGMSLQRRVASEYGNDPVNWIAGVPTPGAATGAPALTPPNISSITPAHAVQAGANDTLTVAATGGGTLSYQWRLDGALLPGGTAATLTLNNFQATNAGVYSVLVANNAGAASTSTRVDLRSPPVILRQPQNQVVSTDGTAVFSVVAGGTPPLHYLWRKNGVNVAGANGPTFIIHNVQISDAVNYQVVITNSYGEVISSLVSLTVQSPPIIVTQPQGTNVLVGQSASFTVGLMGTQPFRYQWRFNGANISGATNATLTLTNLQVASSGNYSVQVTNLVGSVISAEAALNVFPRPTASVVATDPSASEPGADSGQFTILRAGNTVLPLQVFFTISGNAIPGTDYAALASPITIPAGTNSVILPVNVLNDSTREGNETVILTVVNGPNYTVGSPANATVTITDDDNQPPIATLTSPEDGLIVTFPSAILLTASALDADGSVAKVEFYDNGTNKLREDTIAPYDFTWTNAPVGSHVITAVATDNLGSTGASAPVSVIVNARPIVTITSPSHGALIPPGNDITVSASASDADGTVSQVEFYVGATFLGADSTSPYSVSWPGVPEGTYQLSALATDNRGASSTSAVVMITVGIPPPTFGDMFAGRGVIQGYTNIILGTNTSFTREPGEPRHDNRNGTHSGWLSWTAPASGICTMDTFGSSFDTVLAVYTGTVVSNLLKIASNDDANLDVTQSRLTFNATNGVTYQIAVDGFAATAFGRIVFQATLPNPYPIIVTQPQGQVANQGASVTFNVATAGPGPQTFRWRLNGNNIAGATAPSFTRSSVQASHAGLYTVVVSNTSGSVTSAPALLVVNTPPIITTQPVDLTVSRDANAVFTVRATGLAPLFYQWHFNGVPIAGATSSNLALFNVQGRMEGVYSATASNALGIMASRNALLTVNDGLVTANSVSLIELTNFWRYERSGNDLGSAWREAGFDDSSWPTGLAPLGVEPDVIPVPINTVFANYNNQQVVYYFRTAFMLNTNPAGLGLALTNELDDGAVIFLNGVEIARPNMPPGPILSTTIPTVSVGNATLLSVQPVAGAGTNLVEGLNMLAVEVHNTATPTSSDLVFALALSAFTRQTNGPVLLMPDMRPGGVEVTLEGISGRNYALDFSTNLLNWAHLVTWTNFTGSAVYLDSAGINGTRYYRGRLVP
jgi:hypothetical protein